MSRVGLLVLAALAFTVSALLMTSGGAAANTPFALQNRWKPNEFIHIQNGPPQSGAIRANWWSAQWIAVPVGATGFVYLRNRWKPNEYLHIQNGPLAIGRVNAQWWSAMWSFDGVGGGVVRIRNRWKPNVYIHNQPGRLAAGPINAQWWSALWLPRPVVRTNSGDQISAKDVFSVGKQAFGTGQGVKGVRDQQREIAETRRNRNNAGGGRNPRGQQPDQPGRLGRGGSAVGKTGKVVALSPPTKVPFKDGIKAAEYGGDICWKDSYGRGAGTIPRNCPSNMDNDGFLCYPKCRSGYKSFATMCIPRCPAGFTDTGLHCLKGKPYGRGAGYPWKFGDRAFSLDGARARCRRDNRQGCEKVGEIIYPKCKPGFRRIGCCICSPQCPPGMTDIGISCQKNTYDRGVGKLRNCNAGQERDAGLCYPRCNGGYTGIGPVCWAQKCPSQFPVNCGASCAKSRSACISSVANQVLAPVDVVANIAGLVLTGGAANAAKSAATTGAKVAAKAATRAAIKAKLKAQARAMGKELAESAAENAAETMYEASQSGEFDFAALDPTGIASVVTAYAKPLCASVR